MAKKLSYKVSNEEENESYFVSMSDIFAGVLFIFLIIIVFFVLQQAQKPSEENEKYRDYAEIHKARLLERLEKELRKDGIRVQVNVEQDILTLPEGVLFDSGESRLDKKSKEVIESLSRAFSVVLKCSVFSKMKRPMLEYIDCSRDNPDKVFLESIFIEGHTDNRPIIGELKNSPGINSNLRLSARRATETFSYLLDINEKLSDFYSPVDKRIFAVSAYGETRPLMDNKSKKGRAGNRRIDIRLIMYVPSDPIELDQYKKRIDKEFSLDVTYNKNIQSSVKKNINVNKEKKLINQREAESKKKKRELEAKLKAEKELKKKELEAKRKAEKDQNKELEEKKIDQIVQEKSIKRSNLEIISGDGLEWEATTKYLNYNNRDSNFGYDSYYRLKFNALDVGFCDSKTSEYITYKNMIENEVKEVCLRRHDSSFRFFNYYPSNLDLNASIQRDIRNTSGEYYCDNLGWTSEKRKLNLAVVFSCFDENKTELNLTERITNIEKDNNKEEVELYKKVNEIAENSYQVKFNYLDVGKIEESIFGNELYKTNNVILEDKLNSICLNKMKLSLDSYDTKPSWEDKKNTTSCILEVGNFWFCTDQILVNFSCKK